MKIRVQRPARALQGRHHPGLPTLNAARASALPVDVEQHARVHNHHPGACGILPAFSNEAADLYIGYFENRHGEQWILSEGNMNGLPAAVAPPLVPVTAT